MRTATKVDPKREREDLYHAPRKPVLVDVPPMTFLMIDGSGAPGSPAFSEAIEALYATAYALKFRMKKETGLDHAVMPLEGLWWNRDGEWDERAFRERDRWGWTLMIMQPDLVTSDLVRRTVERLRSSDKGGASLDRPRVERFEEGQAVQMLHVGPYAAEPATVELMHAFMREGGLEPSGKHHEIYLGDPRRSAPEQLRTILRQPVRLA